MIPSFFSCCIYPVLAATQYSVMLAHPAHYSAFLSVFLCSAPPVRETVISSSTVACILQYPSASRFHQYCVCVCCNVLPQEMGSVVQNISQMLNKTFSFCNLRFVVFPGDKTVHGFSEVQEKQTYTSLREKGG